jgi:dTDP-4-amino-4,6-dideoxygalactose transaminase
MIPLNDLKLHHESLQPALDAAIAEVIRDSSFIRGPHVEAFESAYAALTGRRHTVSCADGTSALYIAMHALGLQPGDEVIVPGMSWISTSETVTQAGGTVRFCDITSDTNVLDPSSIEAAISPNTVGIIPVHLYGHPAPMPEIMKIAARHGLWVIEDCAQAHLATIDGRMVGSFGVAATYSFYPGKNLGAMGDAGAITTDDPQLARNMAMYARHGGLTKGDHPIEGINSRLDGIQAAVLNVKLPHLAAWTERRREIAAIYTARLKSIPGITVPTIDKRCAPVWHLYVIKHPDRAGLAKHLGDLGIQTAINYPVALPFLPCYERFGHTAADYPNSFNLQSTCLSLPIYPEMTDAQVARVCDAVRGFHDCSTSEEARETPMLPS